tara:strand:- start:102 stop:308 length:207 start_codon:yes stop_codon:yes gene_type:complete
MSKEICNNCGSKKLVFEKFEYCGEYASHDYLCLDCHDQGKIFYDIQYTLTKNYINKNETIHAIKKEKA